jgi:hypothetical protein
MAQFESLENFAEIIENEGHTAPEQEEETAHIEVDGDDESEEESEEAETEEGTEDETEA